MEFNLVNVATICSIISTILTVFSYLKDTSTFYRLILILITCCLVTISILLYFKSNPFEETIAQKKETNLTSLNFPSLDKNTFLEFNDSLNRDSTDIDFFKRFKVAEGITNDYNKSDELALLVNLALRKSKYFWAIKYATKIPNDYNETENLEKIVKAILFGKTNLKYCIIAASKIPNTYAKDYQLKMIIDSCLYHKKYDEAFIASGLINSQYTRDAYKSKILNKMNN